MHTTACACFMLFLHYCGACFIHSRVSWFSSLYYLSFSFQCSSISLVSWFSAPEASWRWAFDPINTLQGRFVPLTPKSVLYWICTSISKPESICAIFQWTSWTPLDLQEIFRRHSYITRVSRDFILSPLLGFLGFESLSLITTRLFKLTTFQISAFLIVCCGFGRTWLWAFARRLFVWMRIIFCGCSRLVCANVYWYVVTYV